MIWRRCVLCALLLWWALVLGVKPEHQQEGQHTGQKNKGTERDRKGNTVEMCPDQCSCMAEEAVDCAGVNLSEFPQELPENTRQLSLQNNQISEIRAEDLSRLLHLQTLNLQNNRLTTEGLEDDGFEALEQLSYLYLANNKLTAAPRYLPPTLISADFAANQLTTIYPYTFGQKPGLKSVYLHNNKLSDAGLPEGMFNGSRNLEVLILSSNFLRYVPKGLPTALFRLHLKNNRLEKIPTGAFENLPHLRELYLQNNLLSNSGMDNTTFSHLSRLEYLDLSNNNLTAVPLGLPRTLMLLHLEKNYITSVRVDSLSAVKDLQYLLLHHNRLRARHIHRDAFRGLKRLHTLHLHHNLLERVPLGLPRRAHTLVLLRNFISEIGRDDLSTLYTLNELNLSYNRLTSERLHRHAFRKLRVLEVLDLSGNKLSTLPLGLPKSLHVLRAKDNQIVELPEGALTGMSKLKELHLSNNQIKLGSIYQGAWQELGSLTVRIVCQAHSKMASSRERFNRLSALSVAEDSFSHLSKLQVLDIGHGNVTPRRNHGDETEEDYTENEEEEEQPKKR
ncbi:hypothetical protein PDJAM_G00078020 [Pangasius djambal]|uniref:Uncharacterized protein n=1 Tax=Pangasius djambal TaxID=1691987 RepID=A0ACC5Z4A1_9TELE|nr:hypothetical protein [Pangasius djambal]